MKGKRVMSFQFFTNVYTFQFPVHQEVKATYFLLIDSRVIYVELEPVLLYVWPGMAVLEVECLAFAKRKFSYVGVQSGWGDKFRQDSALTFSKGDMKR